ncbi:MAG: DUF4331 domain-containing protein [Cyanosarcina radialis HA8281-LM2]|jgi:hypothetical protein|nr:DUF4331 domain-containing protein [Cyanosarcina radialis HA8281-LM2]
MNLKKAIGVGLLALSLTATAAISPWYTEASDHDDGEVDTKGRNVSLTDLYAFREIDRNRTAAADDLILVMNSNPRSLPSQQYYFSTTALYDFNITRVADKNATPTGTRNILLRFRFTPPDPFGRQHVTVVAVRDGQYLVTNKTTSGNRIFTTPLSQATTPTVNQIDLGGYKLSVFAGLREDPFFFDVTRFFALRATLLKNAGFIKLPLPSTTSFRTPDKAVDFAKDYNVNTVVVRVPRAFLKGSMNATTFDVWQTISVQQPNGTFKQFERLGRPGVNEGLIYTNDFLNAFNSIPPSQDLSPAAAPVVAEAVKTLKALGNNDTQIAAIAGAFLPDVLRIDTTQPSNYSPSIPASCLNAKKSPICGRKLEDDVIDLTLKVLTNGAVTTDNVSYAGTPGNPAQGHDPLVGSFPYLALPN